MMQSEWRKESLVIAQTIKRRAEERGITPAQFAFAWVLNNKLVTAAIAGPRTMEQFESYLPALDYRFSAEDEALVDGLVPIGQSEQLLVSLQAAGVDVELVRVPGADHVFLGADPVPQLDRAVEFLRARLTA